MAGLLDFINTPAGMGLLSAAAGYASGARRGSPVNNIGRGLLGGLVGYNQAQEQQTQLAQQAKANELRDMQLAQMRDEMANAAAIRGAARESYTPAMPGMGALNGALPAELQAPAVASKPGGFDTQGFLGRVMAVDPIKGMEWQAKFKKESPINKLDAKDFTPESVQRFAKSGNYADLVRLDKLHFADTGGTVAGLNPFTGQPVGSVPKTGNPFNDLIVSDGAGGLRPNSPLIAAKQGIAKAGATNVQVKTDVKTGESLAGQIGPMMKDSTALAEGAVKQVDAAQRIVRAVDTDKLYAGPGAGVRLKTGQVAQMLGIAGKDEAEKIANTREAVRGLAELTLQGRQQMRGQGAITESEGALAEKAMSGNVEDLTAAEIKQLARASERAARFNYAEHQRKLRVMQDNPSLQGVAPFYQGPQMPAEVQQAAPAAAAAAQPAPVATMSWNPQTRKIEAVN